MGNLTDVQLRGWIRAQRPIAKSDGGGLTFTLSEAGTASWILRYRFGGRNRELTIGRYPDISLSKAREFAAEARVRVTQGHDVAREKQLATVERVTAHTFKKLAEDYKAKKFPSLAPSTVKQRTQHIDKVIMPRLGSVAARDVTGSDIVSLIEAAYQKSSANVAELVFTALNEIFKHGIARHSVSTNPCAGISVSAICGKPAPARKRINLSEDELREILPSLDTIGTENALATRILLATCARTGELARAKWAEVNLGTAEWTIPDSNSKTGKGFVVPLAPHVVRWFEVLKKLSCGSIHVLPARQDRRRRSDGLEHHYEPRTLNKALHQLCDELGDKTRRFTPHDLRSTARSHLAALGVDIFVAERCLNHSLGGLIAIYDRHDYMTKRRAALELWAEFLAACESGASWQTADNVVRIEARR